MTNKKSVNEFDGFEGLDTGMPEEARWQYATIGYNATNGIFYLGDEQVEKIEAITLLAMRQCKDVVDTDGVIHRYPLLTRKVDMVEGDFTSRLQAICMVGGELYIFGARSWTARAAFANPAGGPYSDANFQQGLWYQLMDHVKEVQKSAGKTAPPLCWEFDLAVAERTVTVGTGRNTSQSRPFEKVGPFRFVGADRARANAALYDSEALAEWVLEWGKRTTEQPLGAEEDAPDTFVPAASDIPW